MALVDLKSDLSQIINPSDSQLGGRHGTSHPPEHSDLDVDGNVQNIVGTPLVEMQSIYSPTDTNQYDPNPTIPSQTPSMHGPPDPEDHSTLNLDGYPAIGLQTLFNIPNPANVFGAPPIASDPPDAPTTIDTSNPYPIGLGVVDYFIKKYCDDWLKIKYL